MRDNSTRSSRRRWSRASALALSCAALAIGGVACGTTEAGDPTPVQTWKITPADPASGGTTATPATSSTPDAPTGSSTAAPTGGTQLQLVGVGSQFDVEELQAPPGDITVTFDNQDAGVIHNLSIYEGDSADGDPIATTDLETGEIVQELNVNLEAGEYFYQCDAHPTTMSGTLTVG